MRGATIRPGDNGGRAISFLCQVSRTGVMPRLPKNLSTFEPSACPRCSSEKQFKLNQSGLLPNCYQQAAAWLTTGRFCCGVGAVL